MATQQIEFEAPSGMTLVAKLYAAGSDTIAYTASAVTEQTNRKGVYRATFSNVAANTYQLVATSGAIGVATWWGYAENTATTFQFAAAVGDLNPGAAGEIADAVWDEPYSQHTTAGTFGKLIDLIRKANTTVEGVVTSAITPTTTQFSTNVNYPTGALEHCVLFWVNATSINEQNSPILTYTNINGVIVVEEAFTSAPSVGDEFLIIAGSHVHAISDITGPILNVLSTTPATVLQPVSQSNQRIDIIRGDTYNDIRKPKLRFTVSKNYAGCTITLTIRHRVTDEILLTKTGAVDSATILSVELTGTDTAFSTLPLDEYGLHVFDLQATDGSNNRETIILGGSAVLSLDQTR